MPPLQSPAWFQLITHELADYLHSFPDDHPVHIALRTYALSLSLSLGPSLVPFVVSSARVVGKNALWGILKRELGVSGFAFALTIGVGGGTAIKRLLDSWEATDAELSLHINGPPRSGRAWLTRMNNWVSSLKGSHKTFMCNMLSASFAILLLHSGRRGPGRLPHRASIPMTVPMSSALRQGVGNNGRPSATLDLTLLLLVRAMDMIFRSTMLPTVVHSEVQISAGKEKSQKRRSITTKVDALVFWASSARYVMVIP